MSMTRALIAAMMLSTSTMAMAAGPEPAATPSERRLSPEQIEQVLADAARKREGRDQQGPYPMPATPESSPAPIHGEVGVSIGTGGHRSVYGTAIVGLPGDGIAVLSMDAQRQPDDPYFYPRN